MFDTILQVVRDARGIDAVPQDLLESLRLGASIEGPSQARRVYVERNGEISVIPFPNEPKIVEVTAEAAVQRIRTEVS